MSFESFQFTNAEKAEFSARHQDILAELDLIGTDDAPADQPDQTPPPPAPRAEYVAPRLTPDFDDPDVIKEPIFRTRYDRARQRVADAQAQIAAIEAVTDRSNSDRAKLILLRQELLKAQAALEFSQTDKARQLDSIDEWRADAGREERNAGRRKVRNQPNVRLRDMTPEQRQAHVRELARLKKQRQRAKKRAEKEAAAAHLLSDDQLALIAQAERDAA